MKRLHLITSDEYDFTNLTYAGFVAKLIGEKDPTDIRKKKLRNILIFQQIATPLMLWNGSDYLTTNQWDGGKRYALRNHLRYDDQ